MIKITTPLTQKQIVNLKAGEEVRLTGTIFTARDQAHKRLCQLLAKGRKLPFDLKGQVIYYCGPAQTPKAKLSALAARPPAGAWMSLLYLC